MSSAQEVLSLDNWAKLTFHQSTLEQPQYKDIILKQGPFFKVFDDPISLSQKCFSKKILQTSHLALQHLDAGR